MKKTIQIHLGGVSFTVEEDAYLKLGSYIDAIKKYFATYEGSTEIVEDIESRIAEKLYDKNKSGQVISNTDIDAVIKSMGTVSDFEAFEDEENRQPNITENKNVISGKSTASEATNTPNTKFLRDGRRKVLGGVLSGFSHLLNVDVVWIRIAIILVTLFSLESGFGAFLLLAYIVLWIVMPVGMDFEEDKSIRKLFRDYDNKALGGVASGLATYLNIDIVIIRILFVLTSFVGVGILVYLIFWIVVPKATSLTQKMELSGQALTIENIDSNIKSQAFSSPKTESPIAKILLSPFRIIASILGLFTVLLKPMGSIVRILAGVILVILGFAFVFSSCCYLGLYFNVLPNSFFSPNQEIISLFSSELLVSDVMLSFLFLFVPSISLLIVGVSFITGTRYGSKEFWLTALGIWLVGWFGIFSIIKKQSKNFKNEETVVEEVILTNSNSIFLLELVPESSSVDFGSANFNFRTMVNINTSKDANLRIIKRFTASGKNKNEAIANAKNLTYASEQKDSVLYFDDEYYIMGKKKLRNQNLTLHLELPVGTKFKVSSRFADKLLAGQYDLAYKYGIETEDLSKFTFVMKENNEYACLDCPQLTEQERETIQNKESANIALSDFDFNPNLESQKSFDINSFNEVEIGDAFQIIIEYGTKPSLQAYGSQENLADIKVEVNGNKLEVDFKDPFKNHRDEIVLKITTDKLEKLNLSGATKTKLLGFKNLNKLDVDLSGASDLGIANEINTLILDISGASQVLVKGKIGDLEAELSGASKLNAKESVFQNVKVSASGASEVTLGKVAKNYSGNSTGSSSISKE